MEVGATQEVYVTSNCNNSFAFLVSDDSAIITVVENTFTIKALEVGTTNIRVFVDENPKLEVVFEIAVLSEHT